MSDLLSDLQLCDKNAYEDASGSLNNEDVQVWIVGSRRKCYSARLGKVATGSMELAFAQFIAPSQNVEIVYNGCRLQARVTRCVELSRETYLTTVRLLRCAGREMRAEPRLPVHLDAILRVLGSAEKLSVTIADISQSGLGVRVPVILAVAQQVAVDLGLGIAMAEVRYCSVIDGSKRAGLQVWEFLERELPVDMKMTEANNVYRPGLERVISLIRDRHDNIILPGPEESA